MPEKTFVVTESTLQSALADARARVAAANDEIGRLDEKGHSRDNSRQMREAIIVVEYGQQHIARLLGLLYGNRRSL